MAIVSQTLITFVKQYEGYSAKAFWDYGHYSIGFGTYAKSSSEVITEAEANSRLQNELQKAVDGVISTVKIPLNDNQLAALASLYYNGGPISQYHHLMAHLNSSDFAAAANDFLSINHAGGQVLEGLTKRRIAESQLFLGKYTGANANNSTNVNNPTSASSNAVSQAVASTGGSSSPSSSGGVISIAGHNCAPPPYNQLDRIIYPGCNTASAAPITGNAVGAGYAAPAINSLSPNATPATGVTPTPYNGQLKPGGLIVPLKSGYVVTSGWGPRTPPAGGGSSFHKGIDLAVPIGTPVYAAADGIATIVRSDNKPPIQGYGHAICIQHANNLVTLYGHTSQELIKEGDTVKQGQQIALSGTRYSGPHLHFEIRPNNVPADPKLFLKF